jgi:GTPase SAR1 family protein
MYYGKYKRRTKPHIIMKAVPRDLRTTVKVILVGNSGVGKTSPIDASFNGKFERSKFESGRPISWEDLQVAPCSGCREIDRIDGRIVILQIWDTPAQERYTLGTRISQLFSRDSNVALLCFDHGDQSSIGAPHAFVKRIRAEASDCLPFGVMTKADLLEEANIDSVLATAKATLVHVPFEQFFATSAFTRREVTLSFWRRPRNTSERKDRQCQ